MHIVLGTPRKKVSLCASPGSAVPAVTPSTLPWIREPNSGDCFGHDDGHVSPGEVEPTPEKPVPGMLISELCACMCDFRW